MVDLLVNIEVVPGDIEEVFVSEVVLVVSVGVSDDVLVDEGVVVSVEVSPLFILKVSSDISSE